MRLTTQLFDSRVALRIFGLFLLASFIPLLALGWLVSKQVGGALEGRAFEELETTTRGYGQITLDKLVGIATLLPSPEDAGSDIAEHAAALGLSAAVRTIDGVEKPVFGDWAPAAAVTVAATRPALAIVPNESGYDLVVARRSGAATMLGRIDQEYFWRTNALLARGMEICVLAPTVIDTPLYCSADLPDAARAALRTAMAANVSGRLSWSHDGEPWLSAYWELFLPSRLAAEPWTLVVSQPRGIALESLEAFNRIAPQAALLTLILIAALAITQIRRTLNPLNELMAGTERIAAQHFTTPVRVESHDEFGKLGAAVNNMAEQLQHQFSSLRALADIDRLILQTAEIETVIEALLARLRVLLPRAEHLALVIDNNDADHGHVYRARGDLSMAVERVRVTPQLRRWLATAPSDTNTSTLAAHGIALGNWPSGAALCVAPMLAGETLAGALIAVNADGTTLIARELTAMRELAARVTVAIATGEREAELFRRAHFDALTGLPNRELLDDRLHQAVAQAQREEHQLAVLFIDLDGFKEINDTLGHRSGDALLEETGLRLTSVLRDGDTVARLGGDEYALVLPRVHGPLEAEAVAIKAIEALKRPFTLDGREAFVSASVGVALFPDDGATAEELLRKADMAMYSAKDAGKACYRFFAQEMDRQMQERHALHHDLRGALFSGEFLLAYQPQTQFHTQRLVSVEALLRWRHPKRGLISPTLFVPILEETGLINEIGTWVVRKALADFASWRKLGLPFQRIAVNVSPRQLLDPGFVDTVLESVAAAGLEGHNLEVELTEASLVEDFHATNGALTRLAEHGVRIALDDFGTGYSSLAYLNELVFDTLKIDRAFIVNLPAEKSAAIVKAIIAVANSLGKAVVAEGIETESQYLQLAALGCDYGQGYLLGKPLEATAFVTWAQNALEEGQRRAVGDETRRAWVGDIGYHA